MFFLQLILNLSIVFIISISASIFFKINLSKSFYISICTISLACLALHEVNLFKYSIYIFLTIITLLIFFIKTKDFQSKNFFLLLEFSLISLALYYFSYDRILMDEDELYFWGVKYKHFMNLVLQPDIYDIKNFDGTYSNNYDPYTSYYGNATSIIQSLFTSLVGFKEGGAIFTNNIILLSGFYYLYYDKIKNLFFRIFYLLIFYIVLNNLSFGFLSIYLDPIVVITFSILVMFVVDLKSNKNISNISNIFIFGIILFFFYNGHRISIVFISFIIFIFLIKFVFTTDNLKLFKFNSFFIFLSLITSVLLLMAWNFYFKTYNNNFETIFSSTIIFTEKFFYYIDTLLFSKSYNSQFGASFNAILKEVGFGNSIVLLPEYILHNFVWYIFILYLAYITYPNSKDINILLGIVFIFFSIIIYLDKIIINNTSPQVFGRYISFILIPIILVNLTYLNFKINKRNIYHLISIFVFLIMITPKKTFGFFFPVKFYSNYEITNKNYFNIRNDFKKLANNFDSTFNNKKFKILVLYESKNTSIEYHPSLFESALQLEVYPNEIFFINVNSVIHRYQLFEGDILSNKVNRIIRLSFNTYYNFEGMDGVLFLNTDNDDAEFIINETKKVDYRKNYFYYQTN